MKIRCDFVTNSSSSSFIINKNSENNTKEIVFGLIKGFYKELLDKKEAFLKVCANYDTRWSDKKQAFEYIDKDADYDVHSAIDKRMEKDFGFCTWDYFDFNIEWLECETYEDYVEYWTKKHDEYLELKKKDKDVRCRMAPFFIVDYSTDEYYVDVSNDCSENMISGSWRCEDLIDWYYGCAKRLLTGGNNTFEEIECNYCCCEKGDERCTKFRDDVFSGDVHYGNAVTEVLGNICVHSESGWVPDYVVNKLGELCSYACNHMG